VQLVLDSIEEMEEKFRITPRSFIYTVTGDGDFREYIRSGITTS
jgi:hypothetical protein